MPLKKSLRPALRKKRWLVVIVLSLVVLIIAGLELSDTTYLLHKKKVPQVIPAAASKQEAEKKDKKTSSGSTGAGTSDTTSDKAPSPSGGASGGNLALVQPYGSLVSNHRPGQSGSDTKEQSVCNSTPGATCYIQFTDTSSGKVTRLPGQTVDSNGVASWDWDAKTLTAGKWQIQAFASLNGQTKSVTDSIELEIQ